MCTEHSLYFADYFVLLCVLLIYAEKPPGERFEGGFMGKKMDFQHRSGFSLLMCSSYCLPRSLAVQCSIGDVRLCINNSLIKADNILA